MSNGRERKEGSFKLCVLMRMQAGNCAFLFLFKLQAETHEHALTHQTSMTEANQSYCLLLEPDTAPIPTVKPVSVCMCV